MGAPLVHYHGRESCGSCISHLFAPTTWLGTRPVGAHLGGGNGGAPAVGVTLQHGRMAHQHLGKTKMDLRNIRPLPWRKRQMVFSGSALSAVWSGLTA